jgi:predicted DCC family thiol-disulfide oxidoreductase YuxK
MTATVPLMLTGNTRHDSFLAHRQPMTYPLTIYYESACPLCNAEIQNLMLRNTGGLLWFADVSAPDFSDFPAGTTLADLLALVHGRTADGRVLRGVEVFRLAYQAAGLGWVSSALRLPVLGRMIEAAYPVLARHRHRLPRRLVGLLFEGALRRAAERAAQANCSNTRCSL